MSGPSIKTISDYCDSVYSSLDLSEFKGYFYDAYDEVVDYINNNRQLFIRNGVDFSESMFIPLLTELSTFNIVKRSVDENSNVR